MVPILYSFRRCPYAMRARMAIILCSVRCELREILLRDKPEAMLEISPKGTVPVLQLQDRILDESMEVIEWALQQDSSKFHVYLEAEQQLSHDFIELFDTKFKHHLDRYKYASRFKETADDHQQECLQLLIKLDAVIQPDPWIFGDTVSLLDISILPFVRQCKIANPEWFESQTFTKVISLVSYFESSELFLLAMEKFKTWNPTDPKIVFFQDKKLSSYSPMES
jgi:glutathione S-transferase